jgi:SAM-dependent methyltransferase
VSWIAAAGAVDRSAWTASYDMFAGITVAGGLILDVGCGSDGLQSRGFRLVGLDIVETLLKAANLRDAFAGRLLRADMMTLPFAAGSFEGVWADGSLHHLQKSPHCAGRDPACAQTGMHALRQCRTRIE